MIKLLILGNGQPVKMVVDSLNKNEIEIINVEQDRIGSGFEQENFINDLAKKNICVNKLKDLAPGDYDFVLSMNYNKIIDIKKFPPIKIINLHIGLLPKYRGNNANAWAVLNGENEVGYTLHEVSEMLDGGAIYYKFVYKIGDDETYYNAKNAICNDIKTNLSKILVSIYNNEFTPIEQANSSFVYCTKLRPKDGIIEDWDVNSDLLVRKSYVFGKPLGTGLRFRFKDEYFEIDRISTIVQFISSVGIPGSIVFINNNNLWIKTRDTAVEIGGIRYNNELIEVNKLFKIGMRL